MTLSQACSALRPLLSWLAASGVIPEAASRPTPRHDPLVLDRFEEYLLTERRLQPGTIAGHVARVRRFLTDHCPGGGVVALSATHVTRALLEEGAGRAPASVKKFGYSLRAFLRATALARICREAGETPPTCRYPTAR